MKADFTGSVKPGSELAPPLTDDIACLGLIGSVLTSRIQGHRARLELHFRELNRRSWIIFFDLTMIF